MDMCETNSLDILSFIRCIVPDKDVYTVVRASLHPTLQAWFRESDIDGFVNNILLHKF